MTASKKIKPKMVIPTYPGIEPQRSNKQRSITLILMFLCLLLVFGAIFYITTQPHDPQNNKIPEIQDKEIKKPKAVETIQEFKNDPRILETPKPKYNTSRIQPGSVETKATRGSPRIPGSPRSTESPGSQDLPDTKEIKTRTNQTIRDDGLILEKVVIDNEK